MRQAWIEKGDAVAVVQQCVLAGVSRATIYAQHTPRPVDDGDLLLSRLIDEEYTRRPFYGSRKMVIIRPYRQSQAGTTSDAAAGVGRHGAGAEHQSCTP